MKTSFYSYFILLLCAFVSFSASAQGINPNAANYDPNAILTAPVNYHALAAFLNGNNGNGGNKAAAPANTATTANMPGDGVVVSPTFGAISGPSVVCNTNAQPVTYSVAISSVNGSPVQFYWFVPADWTIVSGQNTNTIEVIPGAMGGQVAVFAIGFCICTYSCIPVSVDCGTTPPCPAPVVELVAPDTVCAFDFANLATFTANLSAGTADTFIWEVPADWMIFDGEGTASIQVMAGFESGNVTVTAIGECGQDQVTVYVTSVECGDPDLLPVEFISFEAARSQASVLLTWATAQEKDNDRFEIERSLDGRTFAAIGSVQGNGTTSYRSDYKFTDASAAKSVVYYRLKQIDRDGKFEYSAVRAVKAAAAGSVTVSAFPNPATDFVTFSMEETLAAGSLIRVVSVTGQQVWSGTAEQLSAQQNKLDLSRLNSGIYIATITSGENTQSIRIVKN